MSDIPVPIRDLSHSQSLKTELALDALALSDQYGLWNEHPDHPEDEWVDQVVNGDTRLGYWEWVAIKLDDEDENNEDKEDAK
jgi:hypothetical protein